MKFGLKIDNTHLCKLCMNVISQLQTQRWYIMLRLYQMNLTETESVPGYRILWLQYNIYCLRK
jgi:hypothetical protein